jgi:hypothetical protein
MFIPVIPVIHRPGTRFRALYDSGSVPMSSCRREAAFPETERRSQGRPRGRAAEVRKNGKPSQAGSGQPEGRSARQRRKPRPNPLSFEGPAEPEAFGRKEPRKGIEEARFIEVRQGTGIWSRKAEKEGTRQGTEAGRKAGRGTRRNRNRASNGSAKEPEGPTGAARPRPEPPWESKPRLRARRTDLGTVEAGGNAGLHFVLGQADGEAPLSRRGSGPAANRHSGESRNLGETRRDLKDRTSG